MKGRVFFFFFWGAILLGGNTTAKAETSKGKVHDGLASLERFLGQWDVSETQMPGPWGEGYHRQGTLIEVLGPGGHSHLVQYTLNPSGKLVGTETVTHDPVEKKIISYAFSDSGPGALFEQGGWDGPNLILLGQWDAFGHSVSIRKILTEIAGSSYTIRIYVSIDGGESTLVRELKLERKDIYQRHRQRIFSSFADPPLRLPYIF